MVTNGDGIDHEIRDAQATRETMEDGVSNETGKTRISGWTFDHIPSETTLRGGGYGPSMLCDASNRFERDLHGPRPNIIARDVDVNMVTEPANVVKDELNYHSPKSRSEDVNLTAQTQWTGWAELENDPEIFTIVLHEWGVPDIQVQEVTDMIELWQAIPAEILGLIFLSRYMPDQTNSRAQSPPNPDPSPIQLSSSSEQPWFANQISKFSCGSVALMNIMMNCQPQELSETLLGFNSDTIKMTSKERGIALDSNQQFRNIHNSFSTKLDRMIVDVMLKDEAQKWKQKQAAQARAAKLAEAQAAGQKDTPKKRKRVTQTKKRKRKSANADDEEENGFHFVAYITANGTVWKLDGMQQHPKCLGTPDVGQTWLNVAAVDIIPIMEEAFNTGQECSLMNVRKISDRHIRTEAQKQEHQLEKQRKQEDWAPFIQHMLRLHCEKGDLKEMLGL